MVLVVVVIMLASSCGIGGSSGNASYGNGGCSGCM